MSIVSEFKEFAMRGNVVDMAVGIVIGGAFGAIVTSFVGDVLMPPIGLLLGGVDFTQFALALGGTDAEGEPVLLKYGAFIQTIVNFLIIAFAIFMLIKVMNKVQNKAEEEEEEAPPEPSEEAKLLAEIRDSLKARS